MMRIAQNLRQVIPIVSRSVHNTLTAHICAVVLPAQDDNNQFMSHAPANLVGKKVHNMRKKLQHLQRSREHIELQYFVPLAAVLLLLTGVLAALLLNTVSLHSIMQENTENYADDVSAQLASNISSRMQMRELYICNLADTFARMPDHMLTTELLERKAKYLNLKEIFVVNPDGTTIPDSRGNDALLQYLADHPELYRESHIFFTKHNEVFYSSPIAYRDGTLRLLIGVRTNIALQQMLQEVNFKNQGMCCIVDSDGAVVVSPVDNKPFQQLEEIFARASKSEDAEEAQRVLADIHAHRSGLAHFQNVDGNGIMLGYDFLEINDWMLLTLVTDDLFGAGSQMYLVRYVVIIGIMAVAMLLLVAFLIWYYRRSIRRIQSVAMTDRLTGGNNYLAFRVGGEDLLQSRPLQSYAIVYMNIKNFKWFNERFGVQMGDQLLKQIYDQLQSCLKEDEELMGRNSGDHFYLLLSCHDEADVERRLHGILRALEPKIAAAFASDYIRFELGAYIVREHSSDFMVLADRAKVASVHQSEGHICRFYDAALQKEIEYGHALDDSFPHAMENHEFQLYIQPKVRPGRSAASGGEALVRWQHPEYGLLFPGDFIPLFEQNGKICELDFYMFEETCRLLKAWLAEGRVCPLSVNLSRAHLVSGDLSFLDRFHELKEQYGIPDGLIELELTESLMLERRDLSLVMTMIDRIREMGFLCSIDDFGFGYSSLSLLKDLNVTTVKLDRQFFLDESERSWLVVGQLIQLSHSLNMTVVAEGIEDREQVERLRMCGCDLVQGYVYAKPMPAAQFQTWSERTEQAEVYESGPLGTEAAGAFCPKPLNAAQFNRENLDRSRLTAALKAAKVCIYEVDLTRQLYTFFQNAEDIFGISGEEILDRVQPYSTLGPEEYRKAVSAYFTHPDDAEVIAWAFEKILHGEKATYEARMKAGDSKYIWCKLDVSPILEGGRPVRMIGVITDISEARKQREMLEQKVNLDGFTGLWNKPASIDLIREALAREPQGRHALLLSDIDHFKQFNDTYGHLSGDQVILANARGFSEIFEKVDVVGRFGGDEFVVFVRGYQNQKHLLEQARRMTQVNYDTYASTNSVGIALYPEHGTSFEELFEQADQALYQAKEQRSTVVIARGAAAPEATTLSITGMDDQDVRST
jgi:diguanylate cyclase (GGDEF)-like protein/PAS domain S-box-containing protein